MRLTQDLQNQICAAVDPFVSDAGTSATLFLYGSRVDDTLKGGDIDLLLLCADQAAVEALSAVKFRILSAIKRDIGDRRVDLSIATQAQLDADPFLSGAAQRRVPLGDWS